LSRAALALLLAACGGGGAGAALDPDEARPHCVDLCDREVACEPGSDHAACMDDCLGIATWMRGDVFPVVIDCVAALACGANDDACLEGIEPLPIHDEWLEACTAAMADCQSDYLPGLCGDSQVELLDPAITRELIDCARLPCAEIDACIVEVLQSRGI
jgi:hypothetical protein